jgi:hypothetical protein
MGDAQRIVERAQEDGTLRPDLTNADLVFAFAANAQLSRATVESAPDAWRRQVAFLLDGLRAGAARRILAPDRVTEEQVHAALARFGTHA